MHAESQRAAPCVVERAPGLHAAHGPRLRRDLAVRRGRGVPRSQARALRLVRAYEGAVV